MSSPPDPLPLSPGLIPETDAFRFDGVVVEGGTASGGPSVRPENGPGVLGRVSIDRSGVAVTSAAGSLFVPWSSVHRVRLDATGSAVAGGGWWLEVDADLGAVRVTLPAQATSPVQIDALDRRLRQWSESAAPVSPTDPRPTVSGPLVAPSASTVLPPIRPLYLGAVERPKRTRRSALLITGIGLIVSALGLSLALSVVLPGSSRNGASSVRTPAPTSSDQQLADRMMLDRADLPPGWSADNSPGDTEQTPALARGEAQIATTLARCMGVSDDEAATILGGRAPDQTAQSASPIFEAPSSSSGPDAAVEIQTAASIVRTKSDEERDVSYFDDPRYPGCAGSAVAAELQLGIDGTAGVVSRPGPDIASLVTLPAPAGTQLLALLVISSVTDGATSVPVEVELVSLGRGRTEGEFQAFAVGGHLPGQVLTSSLAAFELLVAAAGHDQQV